MDRLVHNVADLPSLERSAVESIIGHVLRDDQQLYIAALDAAVNPTPAARQKAWEDLEEVIAEARRNVGESGLSPPELEQIIDQACNDVRYGESPCG